MCIYMSPSLAQRGVEEFIAGGYGFRGVLVSLHSTLMTTDILGIVPRPELFPRSLTVYARTRVIGITSAATAQLSRNPITSRTYTYVCTNISVCMCALYSPVLSIYSFLSLNLSIQHVNMPCVETHQTRSYSCSSV